MRMERELLMNETEGKKKGGNQLKRGSWRFMAMILTVASASGTAMAEQDPVDPHQPVPRWRTSLEPADDLLRLVRDAIPRESMEIKARIRARSTQERGGSTVYAEVLLHSATGLPSAVYTVADAFGGSVEQLIVNRDPDQPPNYRYRAGDPLKEGDVPDLFSRIKSTDLTWVDLSLSYLWWPGGETIGAETIRNRFCYIIEMPAPGDGTSDVSVFRLWVDPKIPMLIQAEGYNADGDRTRRLRVDSFKKVSGIWLVKDINVQRFGADGGRSNLRFMDLKVLKNKEEEEATTAPAAL